MAFILVFCTFGYGNFQQCLPKGGPYDTMMLCESAKISWQSVAPLNGYYICQPAVRGF